MPALELAPGCPECHLACVTRRAVITLQANGVGGVEGAADDLTRLLQTFCRARTRVTMADAERPKIIVSAH